MCKLLLGAGPKSWAWQKPMEGIPRAVQDGLLLAPGRILSVGPASAPALLFAAVGFFHSFYLSPFTHKIRKDYVS